MTLSCPAPLSTSVVCLYLPTLPYLRSCHYRAEWAEQGAFQDFRVIWRELPCWLPTGNALFVSSNAWLSLPYITSLQLSRHWWICTGVTGAGLSLQPLSRLGPFPMLHTSHLRTGFQCHPVALMSERPLTIPEASTGHINYLSKSNNDRLGLLQGDGDTFTDIINLLGDYEGS